MQRHDQGAHARWLGELLDAIDEAQRLAWRLGVVEGSHPQALELYVRLECVRAEVESLYDRRDIGGPRLPPFDIAPPMLV